MKTKEIRAEDLNAGKWIQEKVRELRKKVGNGLAVNALSGGVDSSVVTALGHRALGDRLKTCFIDNGLMRQGEPQRVAALFKGIGVPVEIIPVRKATAITEKWLAKSGAFQYLAILHEDRVTGMKDGKRVFGNQIEIRCWDSLDARTATPTRLPFEILEKIANGIVEAIPEVVSVTYNITAKPPSTIEAI